MDSLRGGFTGLGDSYGDSRDPADESSDAQTPPASIGTDERRMQVRAYNFWASLLDNRSFPSVEDIDPENLPDFGPNSVLLDFTCGIDDPAIQFLGSKLAEECGAEGPIDTLADVPSRSLLSRITDHYMQILANQAPIGFEAEFVNQRGATILYRGILLPFSSDADTIDFIYGVINWKELADQQTTDELLLGIDQALEDSAMPAPAPRLAAADGEALVMNGWADGPADESADDADVLELDDGFETIADDLTDDDHAHYDRADDERVDEHAFAAPANDDVDAMELADWLASARELAEAARGSEDRSRQALYAAIGRAYDFSLAAADAPGDFAELLADSGLVAQDRAPMTPVVKLVFGADYDKTRLAEYASALSHAHRAGLARGSLAAHLGDAPGGLKGVVQHERRLRREEAGKPAALRDTPRAALARKLRKLEHQPIAAVSPDGSEFTLLVARRLASGEVVLLGEIGDDLPLLERAARKLVS